MDQDRHRCLCPTIDAMRYHSVSFYANEVGRRMGRAAAAAREPLSTGRIEAALQLMRVASVYGVSAVGTRRGGRA